METLCDCRYVCGRYRVADIDLWPISTLPVADMVFYVADMVVADIDVIPLQRWQTPTSH